LDGADFSQRGEFLCFSAAAGNSRNGPKIDEDLRNIYQGVTHMLSSKHIAATCITVLIMAALLYAEVPRIMNYQGRLTSAAGIPYSGTKSVTFNIYNGSGTSIWSSGSLNIEFRDGLFTVKLGETPQPPLPAANWQTDTLLSLGIAVAPEPELVPRLRFTTTGYAFTAKTADVANTVPDNSVTSAKITNGTIQYQDIAQNGATEGKVIKWQGGQWTSGNDEVGPTTGWTDAGSVIYNTTLSDSVGIGTSSPKAKLEVVAPADQTGTLITNSSENYYSPALQVLNPGRNTALFYNGVPGSIPFWPPTAIYAEVGGKSEGHAAWLSAYSKKWGALTVDNYSDSGYAITAFADNGVTAWLSGKTALECDGYGPKTAKFESGASEWCQVIDSRYTGSYVTDHQAINGYARPADYYGVGGDFEGGYVGVTGQVNPSGTSTYYGVRGFASGGSGSNYGLYGIAWGNGTNYGVYGHAYSGGTNWAGYFEGDVNITGNIVKSGGGFKIDHPLDPANKYLQHSSVESDEMKDMYDGIATLDAGGKATVTLPEWFEALNRDFRYQLTCIGGYAPVYIASKISGNRFTIAGGTPGLEVSWLVTGVRQDKFAQANPAVVEKEKEPALKGRYLHPELYGLGHDMSVSYDPQRGPQEQAKNEAIRQNLAKAAENRVSTPAKSEKLPVK
jgi:hypothetical protein